MSNVPQAPSGQPPVLLLDIDGTIAPLDKRGNTVDGCAHFSDWQHLEAGGWLGNIFYSREVMDALSGWHRDGLIEIRWLTTWEEEANSVFARLGATPEFSWYGRTSPEAGERQAAADTGWWKERVVAHLLEAGHEVIWIDDEIEDRDDENDTGSSFLTAYADRHGDRLLALSPMADYGIERGHLEAIRTWLGRRRRGGGT